MDDHSTDETYAVLTKAQKESAFPFKLLIERNEKRKLRAGALNTGLNLIPHNFDYDYVLMMDADTLLERNALEKAILVLMRNKQAGTVCSTSFLREGQGLLYRLQKLEYGGITQTRQLTRGNVLISHGLFTLARRDALAAIGWRLDEDMILEDYDLTVRVKLAGFKCIFSDQIGAYTKVPDNWLGLLRQRKRWSLGGLDVVTKYGWISPLKTDILSHLLYLVLFVAIVGWVISRYLLFPHVYFTLQPNIEPWQYAAFVLTGLGFLNNLLAMRYVKNRDWKDWTLRLSLLPEILYTMMLSGVTLYCYVLKLVSKRRAW